MRFHIRPAIVLGLLLIHFYTRHAAEHAIPLALGDGSYAYVYRVSLNLIEGHGFNQIIFPDTPEAAPLRQFTMLDRPAVSRAELDAYFRQPYSTPVHFDSLRRTSDIPLPASEAPYIDDHYKTRVLDLRVAALIWKWFGIRWSVYFTFYSLVSTLAAFCIFLIGREAGGYWAGVVALLFYTACPLENEYLIRSIRDVSPLWFASFSFAFASCVAGRSGSRWARMLSYVGAGAIAAIGYGWRPDALLLPPFLLAFVTGRPMLQRSGIREILTAAGLFVLGTVLCLGGIRLLTPGGGVSPQHGFHMAYYGHAARANLMGVEDSLNVFRCDINTHLDAEYYATANGMESGGEPYLSPAYGAACRAMFVEEMRRDSWHLISQFPTLLVRALRGTGLRDLPINTDYFASPPKWPPGLAAVHRAVLDPLYRLGPFLTIMGVIATLFWMRPVIVAGAISAFLLYYGIILLSVLPEYKHTGLLVLPLAVLSGLAVTSVVTAKWRQARWKPGGFAVIVLVAIWCAACGIAYPYSVNQRAALIDEIRSASAGAPETGGIEGPRLFMVRRDSHSLLDRVGYLLEIQAGAKQAWLHERSVRQTDVTRYYETNHNLLPGRKQYFFTTSYLGAIERAVSFDTTILIDGDARIVSARRVDLSNWKDIEVSTVFYDGERSPGSPRVDGISNRTIYAAPPLNEDLLTADEYLRLAMARVHQLVTFGPTATSMGLRPVATRLPMSVAPELFASTVGVGKVWEAGFMRFTTLSTGGQGWLRSPNLTADGEGTIYLRVRYRLRKGNLAIALFPDGGAPQICQQAQAVREGEFWIESVSIRRHAGQAFFFVIANGYVPHDDPTDADVSEVQLYAQ